MRRKIPITLNTGEITKILQIPNERTKTGLRNKAILHFAVDSGARVSDIVNLRPCDLNIGKGKAIVRGGKGDVDRTIFFDKYAATLLKKYKDQRPKGEYFFCSEYQANNPELKKGKIGQKLNRFYLYTMINKYAKRAGIEKKIGMHTLRHSFALSFYQRTHNLRALQELLGHVDLRTTELYLYMDSTDIKKASDEYYKKRDSKTPDLENRIKALEEESQKLKDRT